MKLIRINKKDETGFDSVAEYKSRFGTERDLNLLESAENVWFTFRQFRERRARAIRFVFEDQWGDLITVNGKTMTQREYLSKRGNVVLQANLMASKANSIVGSHIKEGSTPGLKARRREDQALGEVLSETLRANWEVNDVNEIENTAEFELLFGGMSVGKESFSRYNGEDDARSHMVNVNHFGFSSTMNDPRLNDLNMTVELHDYSFNDFCSAFVHKPEDFKKFREWYYSESSPLYYPDLIDVTTKLDEDRLDFYTPTDSKNCRVIEIWTKERRARYHVFDQQTAELYDINADDAELINGINETNAARREEAARLGFSEDEIPLIEVQFFMDTYWYYRFLTPTGYILQEGESELPNRDHPYTICATPYVNGKICGFLFDAIDLQMAVNRELVVYDWMKRTGTKGVTFVPQDIIPDGMSYSDFAEQWTSMDGIVFYKPNKSGDKPFVEHSSLGNLNTAEMIKMLSDTLSESVSVSGAIMGKTPYAGTSAQLYAQQKENSTTPIAVIMDKLDFFIKHMAIKKTQYIQKYYNITQYEEIASGMSDIDWSQLDFSKMKDLRYKFKFVVEADYLSRRQQANELLLSIYQQGAMNIADVLDLGDFPNADAIIKRLNERAQEAMQQQQQVQLAGGEDLNAKRQMFQR